MKQTPIICPLCGELVLAWISAEHTLVVPEHPDRVTPFEACVARVHVTGSPSRRS